jgi:hypothetical protein
MALTRKKGGGRKPNTLPNIVMPQDVRTAAFDDIITGIVRSFRSSSTSNNEYVSINKMKDLYEMLPDFTSKGIEETLGCTKSTGCRYMEVFKVAHSILTRHYQLSDSIYLPVPSIMNDKRQEIVRKGFYSDLAEYNLGCANSHKGIFRMKRSKEEV